MVGLHVKTVQKPRRLKPSTIEKERSLSVNNKSTHVKAEQEPCPLKALTAQSDVKASKVTVEPVGATQERDNGKFYSHRRSAIDTPSESKLCVLGQIKEETKCTTKRIRREVEDEVFNNVPQHDSDAERAGNQTWSCSDARVLSADQALGDSQDTLKVDSDRPLSAPVSSRPPARTGAFLKSPPASRLKSVVTIPPSNTDRLLVRPTASRLKSVVTLPPRTEHDVRTASVTDKPKYVPPAFRHNDERKAYMDQVKEQRKFNSVKSDGVRLSIPKCEGHALENKKLIGFVAMLTDTTITRVSDDEVTFDIIGSTTDQDKATVLLLQHCYDDNLEQDVVPKRSTAISKQPHVSKLLPSPEHQTAVSGHNTTSCNNVAHVTSRSQFRDVRSSSQPKLRTRPIGTISQEETNTLEKDIKALEVQLQTFHIADRDTFMPPPHKDLSAYIDTLQERLTIPCNDIPSTVTTPSKVQEHKIELGDVKILVEGLQPQDNIRRVLEEALEKLSSPAPATNGPTRQPQCSGSPTHDKLLPLNISVMSPPLSDSNVLPSSTTPGCSRSRISPRLGNLMAKMKIRGRDMVATKCKLRPECVPLEDSDTDEGELTSAAVTTPARSSDLQEDAIPIQAPKDRFDFASQKQMDVLHQQIEPPSMPAQQNSWRSNGSSEYDTTPRQGYASMTSGGKSFDDRRRAILAVSRSVLSHQPPADLEHQLRSYGCLYLMIQPTEMFNPDSLQMKAPITWVIPPSREQFRDRAFSLSD